MFRFSCSVFGFSFPVFRFRGFRSTCYIITVSEIPFLLSPFPSFQLLVAGWGPGSLLLDRIEKTGILCFLTSCFVVRKALDPSSSSSSRKNIYFLCSPTDAHVHDRHVYAPRVVNFLNELFGKDLNCPSSFSSSS